MSRRARLLEEWVAVGCMTLLVLLTLVNVLTRHFGTVSLASTEELSVFLLVVLTLAGGSAAAARDRHLRIEYLYARGGTARRRGFALASGLATASLFVALCALTSIVLVDEFQWGDTTTALGAPRWWFTAWMPPLCALLALRSLAAARDALRQP